MKRQVGNPVQILIDILIAIFLSMVQLAIVLSKLLYELYISLQIMAQTNIVGYFLAIFIGGIILFFTGKYILGSTAAVIKIMAIYVIIVVFLMSLIV